MFTFIGCSDILVEKGWILVEKLYRLSYRLDKGLKSSGIEIRVFEYKILKRCMSYIKVTTGGVEKRIDYSKLNELTISYSNIEDGFSYYVYTEDLGVESMYLELFKSAIKGRIEESRQLVELLNSKLIGEVYKEHKEYIEY